MLPSFSLIMNESGPPCSWLIPCSGRDVASRPGWSECNVLVFGLTQYCRKRLAVPDDVAFDATKQAGTDVYNEAWYSHQSHGHRG
jgi:hypothetical protein